ncbi:ferric reductase-like transmembrane domain-containing protein [Ectothiorhodospira haloalkaliphila]|uniref:sulfite oxidase heme-binding subunit YedZ n=1 Tax=Ectothiorhodospira haloalkaliphila TaxID=421628 RepID=UPI001EE8C1BC|nr:ferric reductase-like transmembrane domain-containing protein [Ectothiorhodospira haloalkaliphila]MCG5525708.1 ferric reductase-like transmembrane domain-containing protein [Ectothiorhodospira haloalkaliphila]
MQQQRTRSFPWHTLARLAVLAAALTPLFWMAWAWHTDHLGVFPEETLLHHLGRWGLYWLLATLALGPAFRLTGWTAFMAVRRQMGLWAFTYLSLHLLVWLGLEQAWFWDFIVEEIARMLHLQVGLISLLLLVPLVLTSMRRTQALLGPRRWQWLHRLGYLSAAGGIWHFALVDRGDRPEVLVSAIVLMGLIGFRLGDGLLSRS